MMDFANTAIKILSKKDTGAVRQMFGDENGKKNKSRHIHHQFYV